MNRRQFVTSGALAGAVSATYPTPIRAATPKRALMKLGATVTGGGGGGEGGGRAQADPAAPAAEGGARGGRRGGGQPRDLDQGFRSLGRWGIKNVVATAPTSEGRLYATAEEF